MSAQTASARRSGDTPALQPQLRTLLLTDLCDSTTLVERLGDAAAAALFRAHDQLVLELQQRWRARLIDRSDGLLLLFERPIDGLGFALDYVRGLVRIGDEHRVPLQARAGLHVGEVLTWRNSDAAVAVGAKPLEVEGLAKPMAGRLMTLARPGQLLLSAVAEPLARRAARELGERGEHLLWKSWGRWRFKGVPEAQEIYEVGEPGLAPLRAPKPTAKAWRDIPLWRRPAALAAEVLVLAGLATGAWFVTRPQPAIAFGERDWVVVADLRNLTDDNVLDDSLDQAFRISLEQSRYVNVLSDLKARDTLALMQRKPDTVLDRTIASEIALRDGARAVILPTVAEVGGKVRVSAEVIDPHTQTTVYAESADGTGAGSTLGSIDHVTAALRGKLGEALEAIEKSSVPLPLASTANLDALRAFALGQRAYAHARYAEALRLFQHATNLDPQFALAWLGQAKLDVATQHAAQAVPALRKAQALRARLPEREALYLDAWGSAFDAPADATGKWQDLARLYPDFWPGLGNSVIWLFGENRFSEALPYAQRETAHQYELSAHGYDMLGRVYLGMERYADATLAFDQALALGYADTARRRAAVEAAQRHFPVAARWLEKAGRKAPYPALDRTSRFIDMGDWTAAATEATAALAMVRHETDLDHRIFPLPAATATWLAGDRQRALALLKQTRQLALAALAQPYDADAADDAALVLSSALLSLRIGDAASPGDALAAVRAVPKVATLPMIAELATVVDAENARRHGDAARAVSLLEPLLTGHEQFQTHVALLEAYADAGRIAEAIQQARWVQSHRGLAYIELGGAQTLQGLNVYDSNLALLREAELQQKAGDPGAAARALQRFDRVWPEKALPSYLRVRRDAVAEASRAGTV